VAVVLLASLSRWLLTHCAPHRTATTTRAAEGNPLKGFAANPNWSAPPYLQTVPSSIEFYYFTLRQIMTGMNDFPGFASVLEPALAASASRNAHACIRFQMDYPTHSTGVPQFLIDGGLQFNTYTEHGGGESPNYNDTNLTQALVSFIAALGQRFDGDRRLGFIQVGLLGFWGEWHTHPHSSWIPASLKNAVVDAFDNAFNTTLLELRVPWPSAVSRPSFGFHDDSFAPTAPWTAHTMMALTCLGFFGRQW
jgi:hypothetical protein